MNTRLQAPIGSGFGARTDPDDILSGASLAGRRAVVTGGYSGLGLETVRALALAGADVIVPARRPEEAQKALAGLDRVGVIPMDLANPDSIGVAADRLLTAGKPVHILINNAAIMASPLMRTASGLEAQFAINHLGHFAFTCRLAPLLAAEGARVVSLSSVGHKLSPVMFDDIQFERRDYEKWAAYGQAKSANSLFAMELDRRAAAAGVRAFAVHPGGIMTPLQRFLEREEMIAAGWITETGEVNRQFKTTRQGAATSLWCAVSGQLEGVGGLYCEDCDVAPLFQQGVTPRWAGVMPHALDPDAASRLWRVSNELTGLSAFD